MVWQIYSLCSPNNLSFVPKSHKKFNIVMLILFICLKLLSVWICYNCSFCIWLVPLSVNYSHIFLCLVVTQLFALSLLNIIHILDLESVCLIPNIYTNIILLIVFPFTCSISYLLFLFLDSWNVNKISISTEIFHSSRWLRGWVRASSSGCYGEEEISISSPYQE